MTHIGNFHHILIEFATYLNSQHIRYKLYSGYDGEYIKPINSIYIFGVYLGTEKSRLMRINKITGKKYYFSHMPALDKIIKIS